MRGRLRIEFGSLSGDASGEHINDDIAFDLMSYGMTVDSSGGIFISISGRTITNDKETKK